MFREGGRLVGTSSVKNTRFGEVGRSPGGVESSDTTVMGDTGASVKATRFGDRGRVGDDERAAGEAGGMPSEKATRFGDRAECSSEPSSVTSEMWLRRRDGALIASGMAGPPSGASRRGALIASGAGGAPPAGATFVFFLKIRCHLCGNQTVSQPERHRATQE